MTGGAACPRADGPAPLPRPIAIPGPLRAQIYAHARAAFPEECCGYLTGPAEDAGRADAAIACRNAQGDGGHPTAPRRGADAAFVIDGAELLAFARSFGGPRPARVVYHSHTSGRAYFSAVDQELARGPAYPVQHLVVGVTACGQAEAALFGWSAAADAYVELARWPAAAPEEPAP